MEDWGGPSVKHKGQAVLIKAFLETAASDKFLHSLLYSLMFRFHIFFYTSVPGYLPYYPASLFQLIKHVHLQTPLNILTLSISQWIRLFTGSFVWCISLHNLIYLDKPIKCLEIRAKTKLPWNIYEIFLCIFTYN